MDEILTCWKEVARYLGKGVRTVQRWETQFQLPIQRLNNGGRKNSIFITAKQIDVWMHQRMATRSSEYQPGGTALQRELNDLRAENVELRARLERAESRLRNLEFRRHPLNMDLLNQRKRLLKQSARLKKELREALDDSRRLQLLVAEQEPQGEDATLQ